MAGRQHPQEFPDNVRLRQADDILAAQSYPDPNDLDQVGLTLLSIGDNYLIAGIVSQDRRLTVTGIDPGDRLVRIDGMNVTGASREAVLSALHGKPGDIHAITVDKDAKEITVQGQVLHF
jgi:C-terminal processing protease CtpA/Prc